MCENDSSLKFSTYNDKRFEKMAEKISFLQKTDINKNSTKLIKLETKFEKLEIDIHSKIKDFNSKSDFLTEELEFVNKLFERNLEIKQDIKKKIKFEINNLEKTIKEYFSIEKTKSQEIIQNILIKYEREINIAKEEIQLEKEEIKKEIFKIKDLIDSELSKVNFLFEDTRLLRTNRIEEMLNNLNDELEYFNNLVYNFFLIHVEEACLIRTKRENVMADRFEEIVKGLKEELYIEKENR